MLRVALLATVFTSLAGCGVSAPTATPKAAPAPKVEPKSEPQSEVYDKVAPMPREAKDK